MSNVPAEPPEVQRRARKVIPFHPLLLALYPVIALLSKNVHMVLPMDVVRSALVSLLLTVVVWGFASLVLRSLLRGAVFASVAALLFFNYNELRTQSIDLLVSARIERASVSPYFLYGWAVVGITVALILSARRFNPAKSAGVFNAFATVLLAIAVLQVATASQRTVVAQASTMRREVVLKPAPPGPRPDVYWIVLDTYPRYDALYKHLGVDTRAFLGELVDRDFVVADQAVGNYAYTGLCLASALNMDYVQNLIPVVKGDGIAQVSKTIDFNLVAEYFRALGYEYVFVQTEEVMKYRNPDRRIYTPVHGLSPFEDALMELTPIQPPRTGALSLPEQKRIIINSGFKHVKRLGATGPKPKFVFAHFMVPHPPFVFMADGSEHIPIETRPEAQDWIRREGAMRVDYLYGMKEQVHYTNRMVLEMVDSILKQASTPPVIIIQGDHGSKVTFNQDEWKPESASETFTVLSAIYAPDNVKAKFHPKISPVNTFRLILSEMFGQDLPLLPDRSFYSTLAKRHDLTEVTNLVPVRIEGVPPLGREPNRFYAAAQEQSARLISRPAQSGAAPAAAAPARGN